MDNKQLALILGGILVIVSLLKMIKGNTDSGQSGDQIFREINRSQSESTKKFNDILYNRK
ncbi:MAG: hypothetical protein AABY22_03400 [Nanoarchaeota archaeon]